MRVAVAEREAPEGYTLRKSVYGSERTRVDLAVREDDAVVVALKSYLEEHPAQARARAEQELASLTAARGPGVPSAIELIVRRERCVLVMEQARGVPLSTWIRQTRPPLADVLDVALQLLEVLARLHRVHLLHREVEPENILVEPDTRQASLIDFDQARSIGAAQRSVRQRSAAAGETALAFMAPEATGRMNRGSDERSDLYSLGATLYFALTGQPPFTATDTLALIHAHMAVAPTSPHVLRPELPGTVCRIVLKLLQKEPEDRYQSATGLRQDLEECLAQLRRSGRIEDDLALASGDPPPRPLFARKLYGRETELESLLAAYARARTGRPSLVLLSGGAGSGKSTLAHELRRPAAETGGYLVAGKFDLYRRDVPHSGWIALLSAFADQLLLESNERLARWRSELCLELHNVAGALLELVPDLGAILGEVPAVPRLAPKETQARLELALERFVLGAATREHPVVLFLDDLQWADAASLHLLETIVNEAPQAHLLLLCSYREAEDESSSAFAAFLERVRDAPLDVRRIELTSLGSAATARMLADALGRDEADAHALAETVMRKTGSIPLLVQQFVLHMHELGHIYYTDAQGWCWSDAEISAAQIPEGAVMFMVGKLRRLPPPVREVLEFASCIADEIDAALLSQLSGRPEAAFDRPLFELVQQGLLAPSPQGFRFVHDRIREAAQQLLSADARASLHWSTAHHLLSTLSEPELAARAFELADHLNRAGAHVPSEARLVAIEYNRMAGARALAAGAGATAATYLSAARELLCEQDWRERWPLCFELHLWGSESAYQAGRLDEALELLDPIERPDLAVVEIAQVAVRRIQVYAIAGESDSVAYTLSALARVGVRWPLHPSPLRQLLAIASVEWRLWRRRKDLARGLQPDPEPDLRRAPIEIIEASGALLLRADIGLFVLSVGFSVARQLQYGYVSSAAFSLGGYAAGISLNLMSSRRAAALGDIALSWAASAIHPLYSHRVDLIVHGLIRPFVTSRAATLATLGSTVERMLEMGDPEYAYYALTNKVALGVLGGESLVAAHQGLRDTEPLRRKIGYRYAEPQSFLKAVELLCAPNASSIDWDRVALETDAWMVEQKGCNEPQVRTMWTLLFCIVGRFDLAFDQSEQIWSEMFRSHVLVHIVDHTFYRGLAAAALADSAPKRRRRTLERELRRCLRKLRRWARHGPDFVHMVRALDAELARLRGARTRASHAYRRAALRAAHVSFGHHVALVQERHARLLLAGGNRMEAAVCLGRASAALRTWGARGRARDLQSEATALSADGRP